MHRCVKFHDTEYAVYGPGAVAGACKAAGADNSGTSDERDDAAGDDAEEDGGVEDEDGGENGAAEDCDEIEEDDGDDEKVEVEGEELSDGSVIGQKRNPPTINAVSSARCTRR